MKEMIEQLRKWKAELAAEKERSGFVAVAIGGMDTAASNLEWELRRREEASKVPIPSGKK